MPFTPLHDRVLVLPDALEEVTAGGILIPEIAQKSPPKGTVVAVGSRTKELQTGKKVQYNMWAGTSIDIEGRRHLIMREEEVFYVLY